MGQKRRGERRAGRAYLRVKEEDVCVLRAVALADALRQLMRQEQGFARPGLGLDQQRTDGDVVHNPAETSFQRAAASEDGDATQLGASQLGALDAA